MKYKDLIKFGFEMISDMKASQDRLPIYTRAPEADNSQLLISLESTIIDKEGNVKSGFFKFANSETHLTSNVYVIIFMLADKKFMHLSDGFRGITLFLDYEGEDKDLIKEIVFNYI